MKVTRKYVTRLTHVQMFLLGVWWFLWKMKWLLYVLTICMCHLSKTMYSWSDQKELIAKMMPWEESEKKGHGMERPYAWHQKCTNLLGEQLIYNILHQWQLMYMHLKIFFTNHLLAEQIIWDILHQPPPPPSTTPELPSSCVLKFTTAI